MYIRYAYLRGYLPTAKDSLWILFARLFTLVIISLLLSGCAIPVAPFYDEPFPKDLQTKLNAGASQDEVVHLLGAPNATRLNGKFWYYGGTRPLIGIFVPDGGGFILDHNWIEVAFDDELRLQYMEHYESKSGCARSKNCLLWGEWDPVSNDMTDQAIFTRPPDQDTAAKMFSPPINGCAIYVFCTSRTSFIARALLLDDVIAVRVQGSKPSWLNIDTYLRVEVPLGAVEIFTSPMSKKQWNCETNDVSFVWVQGTFSGPDRIEKVDAATGKEEIMKRRLLLPP
jgi:hypothetical protein